MIDNPEPMGGTNGESYAEEQARKAQEAFEDGGKIVALVNAADTRDAARKALESTWTRLRWRVRHRW